MAYTEHITTFMILMLIGRIAVMGYKVVRPAIVPITMCLGCSVVAICVLVPTVFELSKLVSPQRDLGKFVPLNITPTVIFSTALFMCVIYIFLSVYVFVSSIVVPVITKGPLELVPKGKEKLYDLRDRKATLAA